MIWLNHRHQRVCLVVCLRVKEQRWLVTQFAMEVWTYYWLSMRPVRSGQWIGIYWQCLKLLVMNRSSIWLGVGPEMGPFKIKWMLIWKMSWSGFCLIPCLHSHRNTDRAKLNISRILVAFSSAAGCAKVRAICSPRNFAATSVETAPYQSPAPRRPWRNVW